MSNCNKKSNETIQSFWNAIQKKKYNAALRLFHSDAKSNIFHDIETVHTLSSFLKDNDNAAYQEYFVLFILHNGLNHFMSDAKHSRRWEEDKYHENVMIIYDLLRYLSTCTHIATASYHVRNKHMHIWKVLIRTLDVTVDVDNILGYPYFQRHLQLFWHYFMVPRTSNSSKCVHDHQEAMVHHERLKQLTGFGFDSAIESIYLSMHESKYSQFSSVRKYRGFILQILSTIYYFYSSNVEFQWKLDNKHGIMMHILTDYFMLNCSNCDDHYLYSTERHIAKFMSHPYNFAYFMDKIVELIHKSHKMVNVDTLNKRRTLLNAQNIYRVLTPFEMILTSSHSSQRLDFHINTLLNTLQRIWKIQRANPIVHNRFIYLTNDGNIDNKLGKYGCDNMKSYSWFEIVACHILDILIKNYVISFNRFNKMYLLQRNNRKKIVDLLRMIYDALQHEKDETDTNTLNIQHILERLCSIETAYDRRSISKSGINEVEFDSLRGEMMELNMSFVGQIPMHILSDIINYYQRTFLYRNQYRYPLDVHKLILRYSCSFACDPVIESINCGQIVLFDVDSSKIAHANDRENVFDGRWMICRVQDIVYGSMGNIIQLLISYKIGADNYGCLWLHIGYKLWLDHDLLWRCNVIVSKKHYKRNETLDKHNTFISWWNTTVQRWIQDEKIYKITQKKKVDALKPTKRAPLRTPYLTLHTKRQYKRQRK